jgi:hypothetical protein
VLCVVGLIPIDPRLSLLDALGARVEGHNLRITQHCGHIVEVVIGHIPEHETVRARENYGKSLWARVSGADINTLLGARKPDDQRAGNGLVPGTREFGEGTETDIRQFNLGALSMNVAPRTSPDKGGSHACFTCRQNIVVKPIANIEDRLRVEI